MTQEPHSIPDEARSADAGLTSAPDTLLDETPEGLPGEPDNLPDTLPDEPSEALPGEAPEVSRAGSTGGTGACFLAWGCCWRCHWRRCCCCGC